MRLKKLVRTLSFTLLLAVIALIAAGLFPRRSFAQKTPWPATAVRGAKAMVVSDEELADDAGIEILKQGGNAIDAGAAVGFALAVVEPAAGNIGGGGFMLIREAGGRTAFVDYRETAPKKASRDMYMRPDGSFDPEASIVGYRSVGVPGTVAGLALAVRTYGKLTLKQVMQPAIRLADQGFPVSEKLAASLREAAPSLSRFSASKKIFLKDGAGYKPGEVFRQPELAAALRLIAANGPDEFYRGDIAHHLSDDMAKNGGLITLDDLAAYTPKIREPLTATYHYNDHEWKLITSPPPSSGGIAMIEALNILDPVELKNWDDAQSVHWVAEAMRRVFADRAAWLADSDFTHVPLKGLTDPRYAAMLRAEIDPTKATPSSAVKAGNPGPFDETGSPANGDAARPLPREAAEAWMRHEAARSGHTTHFSVVDGDGNAVSNTYTLNDWFGSAVTTPDGFLLNDEMDDFTAHPGEPNMFGLIQSEANTVGPGKRPLSSMTPSILLRDGQLSFVTGSPGGPTIISATLLTILNWMRLGMDAQQAINAPRFHHQWIPDELRLESNFSNETARELERRGYTLDPSQLVRATVNPPVHIGQVEAIGIDPKTGERLGAADPRRHGTALGY
ncbi:MAG: gamma-glutamyltransferase [Candidatus Acidiferrales bacterium]